VRSNNIWLAGATLLTVAGTFAAGVTLHGAAATIEPMANPILMAGKNPYPAPLARPTVRPLSTMAELGRQIFFDATLSSSGKLSCASCHSPDHAYGPLTEASVVLGGPDLSRQGTRAVPSLMYLERQPNFSIGPDDDENESVSLLEMATIGQQSARAKKTASNTKDSAANMVPQGGLFWDGRVDTLQDQALYPLLSPNEMDGGSVETVAAKLQRAPYAERFVQLFGPTVFKDPKFGVAEAMFAVARFQIEDPSFHPYTSKFDFWLEGKATLNPAELRGYLLYNDKEKANCGGCHVDLPGPDGLPPLFTDHQYEALGAPRNRALAANNDPDYIDLGICGPSRQDMADQAPYCAMFTTPTLRNTATRHVFFHNGVFHSLQEVMDFYNFRDTDPQKVYPRAADGTVNKLDDVPPRYRDNVDVADPPFDRNLGDKPAMTAQDEQDIIAFLQTLTDGYDPTKQ
jgi:cytochrome c peroxidase